MLCDSIHIYWISNFRQSPIYWAFFSSFHLTQHCICSLECSAQRKVGMKFATKCSACISCTTKFSIESSRSMLLCPKRHRPQLLAWRLEFNLVVATEKSHGRARQCVCARILLMSFYCITFPHAVVEIHHESTQRHLYNFGRRSKPTSLREGSMYTWTSSLVTRFPASK